MAYPLGFVASTIPLASCSPIESAANGWGPAFVLQELGRSLRDNTIGRNLATGSKTILRDCVFSSESLPKIRRYFSGKYRSAHRPAYNFAGFGSRLWGKPFRLLGPMIVGTFVGSRYQN